MKTTKKILTIAAVVMIIVGLNQAVHAAGGWNGVYLNGVYLNGVSFNGVYLNGVSLNSHRKNDDRKNRMPLNTEKYEVDSTQIRLMPHNRPNGIRINVVTERECSYVLPTRTAIIK